VRLIAKAIRISLAKFHYNRLTTVQYIQYYASLFVTQCRIFLGLTIHRVSKNCAFLFLSELRQISTNFNNFWYVGKVSEINATYALPPHLTHVTALPC